MSGWRALLAALILVLVPRAAAAEGARRVKPHDDGPNPLLVAGWLGGVVGLAGIGVGVGFGGHASSQWDEALGACPSKKSCSAEAVELADDAGTSADIATGAFVVGGAFVAAGVALIILALVVKPTETVAIAPRGLAVAF